MIAQILVLALSYAQIALALAACLVGYRVIRGPRAQDRVMGIDALYIIALLLFLVTGMRLGSVFFFEAAMIIALLGFVSTVALAKFLFRGEVIE